MSDLRRRLRVVVDREPLPWQREVLSALARVADLDVEAAASRTPVRRSAAVALYARLDRWRDGRHAPIDSGTHLPAYEAVVDLAGGGAVAECPVLFAEPSALDEDRLVARLARGERTLRLEVRLRRPDGAVVVAAASTIGLVRLSARRSTERIAPRIAALFTRAVQRLHEEGTFEPAAETSPSTSASSVDAARILARAGVAAARVAVTRVDWRVAYGRVSSPDPFALPATFESLASPVGHFYADPFVVTGDEGTFVFVEDFDVAAGRAGIAVVDVATGQATTVLAPPYHLSYPFVFEAEGAWWMVPESAAASEVVLHRCTRFPAEWERHEVLLAGLEAYDATLLQRDGRWWLFFASGTPGAPDDELHVWFADSLQGPYEPHPLNPVVSSVVGARPAGRLVVAGDRLLRPGQDGSREYGGAIVVHEMDELTPTRYREHPVARIDGRAVGAPGTHTYNRAGDVVVVDTKHRVAQRSLRSGFSARYR